VALISQAAAIQVQNGWQLPHKRLQAKTTAKRISMPKNKPQKRTTRNERQKTNDKKPPDIG
jgi:hypothetical protein